MQVALKMNLKVETLARGLGYIMVRLVVVCATAQKNFFFSDKTSRLWHYLCRYISLYTWQAGLISQTFFLTRIKGETKNKATMLEF